MADRVLIEAVKPFEDRAEGVGRKPGDRWEVDQARFKAINSTSYGELAVLVSEPKPRTSRKARTPKNEETL